MAVQHAAMLTYELSIPPLILGITFFALGTDIPEIGNSAMASVAGHGDLIVGDSMITLKLGILPSVGPYRAAIVPMLAALALVSGILSPTAGSPDRMVAF